ncbi:YebC/PmpR family DNA-binding transcriptional regulator [bacterium]|jgi:YebC/PmpR family DNA-binding regulatory protein|nr:YebC/PmpR family DNA-binding transcriptional regulator [bacterium]MDP6571518.1 YebC/PmpR family DNA-binding transcriptional regulator [Patescibacteria group bacterium]|tara:strand:+ start:841 stop:1377 length:537 start_codon:yes stop_codon:yes gene_type:complete
MSGHSKWSSIKHKKAATDAKKGAVFTRMANNIALAAREHGADPETNFKLKMAIDQAKAFNVPKDNIERAIKRGTGQGDGDQLQEAIYEAYGPGGTAIIIKVITDNTNRAVSDIRHALTKHGASLGKTGSVTWNFDLKDGEYAPKQTIELDEAVKKKLNTLTDALEELEDVQDYYTNEA